MACTDPSDGNRANKVEKRSKTRCKMETPNKAMQKTITTPIGKSGDRSHTVDGTMWWPTIARFFWYQQNCVPIDHHLWVWFLPYPVPLQDYLSSGVDISLVQRVQGPNKWGGPVTLNAASSFLRSIRLHVRAWANTFHSLQLLVIFVRETWLGFRLSKSHSVSYETFNVLLIGVHRESDFRSAQKTLCDSDSHNAGHAV